MHRAPGTGIGLSTVKMAAEAHQGHVWVISSANEGTTFFLSLPQQEGRKTVNRELGNLLIVDFERSIRISLRTILANFGYEVVEAARGEEALALARTAHFDAVLLDINMPGMGGIEVCRTLRRSDPRLPIVMLTVQDVEDRKSKHSTRVLTTILQSPSNCGNCLRG